MECAFCDGANVLLSENPFFSILRRSSLLHWLEQTYRDHRTQLFRCAWLVLRSEEDAEDAVHAAFARSLGTHDRPDNAKAYMLTAVRNAAFDLKRQKARAPNSDVDIKEPCDHRHKDRSLDEYLESLPHEKREVVELRLRGGLTFVEIADLLREPVSTVTSRYKRAISHLRELHGVIDERY